MNQSTIICIIDDDGIYQFYMKKIIHDLRNVKHVISFGDGEEALEFFQNNISTHEVLPNIILLDINMPIMDGWQFLEEYSVLKPRIQKKIIVYMVTSSNNNEDIEHAKQISEISDYLIKPITPEQMEEIVNTLQHEE